MKPIALVILCLVAASQGRVLLPKEAQDIPVAIVQDPEPLALIKPVEELKKPIEIVPELEPELKPIEAEPIKELEKEIIKEEEPLQLKTLAAAEPAEKIEQPETVPKSEDTIAAEPVEQEQQLKQLAADNAVEEPAKEPVELPVEEPAQEAGQLPQVRQATQATPTQSTTQQNFVQQLIQNSPIGQFLNQFNPQQQQQQTQQVQQVQLADQPATAAPTVPGFLNPAAAITSAQQAVQNAAQSVVNSTTQAFQGIQQFANNLGTQFQNTLSGLTGQQVLQQQPVVTTPRPPGPIQSFVNNVFGGNQNATVAAAPAPQQPGPLQGIINFLGGNRPQTANAPATPAVTEAPIAKPPVDDKIEEPAAAIEALQPESDDINEVRNSAEAIDDSFEEAVPAEEMIVVNDDAAADAAEQPLAPTAAEQPLALPAEQQQPTVNDEVV